MAYAEHLLAGGVLPWAAFLAEPDPRDGGPGSWQGDPPGAAQAELLRRLDRRVDRRIDRRTDRAGGSARRPGRSLGEHVLRRAAPGRGRADLLLTDPPEVVPVAELLRVGAGVLADLVAEQPLTEPEEPPARPPDEDVVPPGRAPTYRLEGPPLTVADLRRRLTAAGLPPGHRSRWSVRRLARRGRPDVVLVVALPLEQGLGEVWSRRTQRGATKSWSGVLTEWHAARRLPPALVYDRLAAGWAARLGAGRVHVLTGDDLDGQLAAVLGHRPAARVSAPLPWAYIEVVRRTSVVLTFRVPPEEKQQRLDLLVRVLTERRHDPERRERRGPRGAVVVPSRQRAWVRRTGRLTASRLRTGGYVLHGPVTLGRVGRPERPSRAGDGAGLGAVLDALLESVLVLAHLPEPVVPAAGRRTDGGRGAVT